MQGGAIFPLPTVGFLFGIWRLRFRVSAGKTSVKVIGVVPFSRLSVHQGPNQVELLLWVFGEYIYRWLVYTRFVTNSGVCMCVYIYMCVLVCLVIHCFCLVVLSYLSVHVVHVIIYLLFRVLFCYPFVHFAICSFIHYLSIYRFVCFVMYLSIHAFIN